MSAQTGHKIDIQPETVYQKNPQNFGSEIAMPIQLPFDTEKTTQINDNQRSQTRLVINESGLITMDSHYWNDNQIDGDHYLTAAIGFDQEQKATILLKDLVGLDARFGGHATEKDSKAEGQIPQEQIGKIEVVEIHHALISMKDDNEIWKLIGQKVGEAILAWLKDKATGGLKIP